MPTALPRYQVTETPDVARALDAAERRWPGERRSNLLRRLIQEGAAALDDAQAAHLDARRAAIDATSGKYDECFDGNFLARLREDWPE